ncbi:desulfoferrodoxin family protein [Caproiciproducens sp.]|uniref:desulfoferrodoxin family protein n=1 Tax=Caproiciproducens sp. TaxID=1954376 RepID=UPI00289B30F7|nr:desulfoferrodoxin family protein [Caproiciproducens sp.]
MSNVDFYRCELCGNMVALIKKGGGTLTCCGQEMTKLEANSTDAAQEKHVPVITREGGKLKVSVGSVLHPMLPEHHIEWIALATEDKVEIVYLKPGMEPKAEFNEVASGTVYEYCNLHGLWKAEF